MKWNETPFDLQLFAEADNGSLLNTTATMSAEMRTFYEKRLIDQAEPRLVHDQFADYYPVPVGGGKTIEFRKYDSLPKATTPPDRGRDPRRPGPERLGGQERPAPVRRLDPDRKSVV